MTRLIYPPQAPEEPRRRFTQRGRSSPAMHFVIEFVLDTTCPHSYVGLRNLNEAMTMYQAKHPSATFEVTCSPFILNPSTHQHEFYETKSRSHPSERTQDETRQGLCMDRWTGNSRDSHKLLRLALEPRPTTNRSTMFTSLGSSATTSTSTVSRGPAVQMRLLEALFQGYFEHNLELSDRDWLTEVGTTVGGFRRDEVRACLESEDWGLAIDTLDADAQSRLARAGVGVGDLGLPTFIFQGRLLASGYQETDFFLEQFERLRTGKGR